MDIVPNQRLRELFTFIQDHLARSSGRPVGVSSWEQYLEILGFPGAQELSRHALGAC